jgi:hypothetical protein
MYSKLAKTVTQQTTKEARMDETATLTLPEAADHLAVHELIDANWLERRPQHP